MNLACHPRIFGIRVLVIQSFYVQLTNGIFCRLCASIGGRRK